MTRSSLVALDLGQHEFRESVETLLNEDQKVRLKKVTLIDNGELSIEPSVLLAAMDYLILKEDGNKAG